MYKTLLVMDVSGMDAFEGIEWLARVWNGPLLPAGTSIVVGSGSYYPLGMKRMSVEIPRTKEYPSTCSAFAGTTPEEDETRLKVEIDLDEDLLDANEKEGWGKLRDFLFAHGWRKD